MRISEITLEQVRLGSVWKLVDPEEMFERPLQELEIESAQPSSEDEYVVYSSLFVTDDGAVSPWLLVRRVGDPGYGGSYLEMKDGRWRQLGLEPDPDAPFGKEYVANPLEVDPSFDSPDDRARDSHRSGFREWVVRIQ